jgi:hypothetical protein
MSRGYIAIRREKGKADVTTNFPITASPEDAVFWWEADGYKVIEYKYTETPEDQKFIGTTIVTVETKTKIRACPHCGKPGMIEEVDGQTYYVHKQTVEFGKETTNFGFRYCPQPPKAKTKAGK